MTTGPGGINALNGVFGAYVDSQPMVVISGQVKRETMVGSYDLPLRQLGDQEVDIVALARRVTKMSTLLQDPRDTRRTVERALWLARSERPGPVWIDIPGDVQSALVDESTLVGFEPGSIESFGDRPLAGSDLGHNLGILLERLRSSSRPVVLAGSGIRIADAYEEFLRVIDKLQIPVTTAWNAHDLLQDDHPLYVGRPGTVGDRPGNFAVQNADFLLVLGSRLNIRQISYNWQSFARAACIAMIDVDKAELLKPTLKIDLPIHADLKEALSAIAKELPYVIEPSHAEYLTWCQTRRARYPVEAMLTSSGFISAYSFLGLLFDELHEDDVIVTGDGTACVVTFQVARIKRGQRLYTNSGCASMGYDLPAAIGAAIASGGRRVICVAGDGSAMLNLQELQTIAGNQLPIKIVILANNGYSSIRQTQRNYFPDNIVGCDAESGLSFPDFQKVGRAFGISSARCAEPEDMSRSIRKLLHGSEPKLLEVVLDPDEPFAPKLASRKLDDGTMVSSPLEDMAPFLARDELGENMLIPLWEDN